MHTLLKIEGTHCDSCKALIEDVARELKGVTSCEVDFHTGETHVLHDNPINWEQFEKEIGQVGPYRIVSRTSL